MNCSNRVVSSLSFSEYLSYYETEAQELFESSSDEQTEESEEQLAS